MMKKTVNIFLFLAALTSLVFILVVEYHNDLTLDDLGFALLLHKENLWKFIADVYNTWQGRFMSFLITGLQLKSYFLFKSMLPGSILMYSVNIILVSKSFSRLFGLRPLKSALISIIIFQIYVLSMLDISSYFWLCTKAYSFIISLSLYALSILLVPGKNSWYDYLVLFITFAFLGCSYEIYAPLLLLVLTFLLLYKFYKSGYKPAGFFHENKRIVFALAVGTLFFTLMVIAPGNWIRMNLHAKDTGLPFPGFIYASGKGFIKLLSLLVIRLPYFLAAGLILHVACRDENISGSGIYTMSNPSRHLLSFLASALLLTLISVMLSTWATGAKIPLRAFNHVNLICFIFVFMALRSSVLPGIRDKLILYAFPLSLVFITSCNLYSTFSNIPELKAYDNSVKSRMAMLNSLRENGNKETVKLSTLNAPVYHSIDDILKLFNPKLSKRVLLRPNDVTSNPGNYYNRTYREYYGLGFDVVTDLKPGI